MGDANVLLVMEKNKTHFTSPYSDVLNPIQSNFVWVLVSNSEKDVNENSAVIMMMLIRWKL